MAKSENDNSASPTFGRKSAAVARADARTYVPATGSLDACQRTEKSRNLRRSKTSTRSLRQLCADLSPEDGVDPKLVARSGESTDRRKTWQLCSQVHDALRLILGEAADERLHALDVREVLPAPNDSQLLVLLVPLDPLSAEQQQETAATLESAAGWLRTEITSSITRKRAPRLVLQLLPAQGQKSEHTSDS